jgi:hypothetical protein
MLDIIRTLLSITWISPTAPDFNSLASICVLDSGISAHCGFSGLFELQVEGRILESMLGWLLLCHVFSNENLNRRMLLSNTPVGLAVGHQTNQIPFWRYFLNPSSLDCVSHG